MNKNGNPVISNVNSPTICRQLSCTAASDLHGIIPYFKTTSTNLRSGPQIGVWSSTPKHTMLWA